MLSGSQRSDVEQAVDKLYSERQVRLWVVYVDSFAGAGAVTWAQRTRQTSDLEEKDAILAVATQDRSYAFLVPTDIVSDSASNDIRRNAIEPKLRDDDWGAAAVAAAEELIPRAHRDPGVRVRPARRGDRPRRARARTVVVDPLAAPQRREAEFAAAQRVDPSDPNALASVQVDALDDLSKSIVVEVDNAVRTSDNELTLAVEEFGNRDTRRHQGRHRRENHAGAGVQRAPDPRRRRSRDHSATARPVDPGDRGGGQSRPRTRRAAGAFAQLRDLVINAPSRLDSMTQQMVDLTARLEPSQQALTGLHKQFSDSALASVAGNVDTAKQRLSFADQNITNARNLLARPADRQTGLVDAIRAAESALGQARTLLDAVDSAATESTARSPPCRRRSPTSRTASRLRKTNWPRPTPPSQ